MAEPGSAFNDKMMKTFDEDCSLAVKWCMFPAFGITVRDEGTNQLQTKILVRADVELGAQVVPIDRKYTTRKARIHAVDLM